jgi:hypothetical protein
MRPMHRVLGWTNRSANFWGSVSVFVVAFVALAVSVNREISLYDEGVILTAATRLMAGAIPHRDFYVPYGPGQFWVLAFLFKLLGPSVLVERLWDVTVKAAIIVCVFLIGKRVTTLRWSIAASTLSIIWLSFVGVPGWPVWPALFILLLESLLLLKVFDGEIGATRLVAAGACIGVATLFRYDIGFLICASQSTVLFLYCFNREIDSGARLRSSVVVLLQFWGGVALIGIPVAIAYLFLGAISDFWFDVVEFPMHFYAAMRSLPFPTQFFSGLSAADTEYIVYLPLAVGITSIVALLRKNYFEAVNDSNGRAAQINSEQLKWRVGLLTAIMLAFYAKGYVRVSAVHVSLALVPCFIIVAAVASAYTRTRPLLVAMAIGLDIMIGLVPTLHAGGHVALAAFNNIRWGLTATNVTTGGSCRPAPGLERTACFVLGPDQTSTVLYLQERIPAGEPIFVGLTRHDKVFANDVGLYFVSKFRPITKWYQFDPGLQTNAIIQASIIEDLERAKPKFVVLDSKWENVIEPNDSSVVGGVVLLDHYIVGHYNRVASFGTCSILERTDEIAASGDSYGRAWSSAGVGERRYTWSEVARAIAG